MTHATELSALEVDVYKTAARPLTFLFVPSDVQPDCWPADLCALFRAPEKVLSIRLTPHHTSAAQAATTRIGAIRARGYFLQLPPDPQVGRR